MVISIPQGQKPADFGDVRATNLAVVLRHVRGNQPCSRADIAATTGLNKATVSSLVADLIDRQLLRETGQTENRIGRPATMLQLDGSPYVAIGLEVNADYITVVVVDLAGVEIVDWQRAFPGLNSTPAQAAAAIAALGKKAARVATKRGRRVLGLTVGVPGLVDSQGVVRLAPNLRWQGVDLRDLVTRALGNPEYPVNVDNDANLAVIAESRYGAFAGTPNIIYLTGEVGIGAGIISGGRLLRGVRGFAGEIGHIQVDPHGPPCACGRKGCLEACAGIGAITRDALPDSLNGTWKNIKEEVEEVKRRAEARNKAALDALANAGEALGRAIGTLANLLDPAVLLLGGYFVPLAKWLIPPAMQQLKALGVAPEQAIIIAESTLGHGAAARGGTAIVLDHVDAGNLPRG